VRQLGLHWENVAHFPKLSRSLSKMNKSLVAIVLACAGLAGGQEATPPAPAQPAASPQKPQQQKKEIKDPAEYNAYVGAVQQQDVAAKISGLEAFLAQYPNSVMKDDALELLMGAYQQSGNQAKMIETAQRLLQANPNNVRALALLAYSKRTMAQAGQNPQQNLAEAKQYGEKGLQALQNFAKPEGMSDADYQKLKGQMQAIFSSAVGLAALQDKDYATAVKELRVAVDASPADFSLVYPLALAYLQSPTPDYINGIWYAARASVIAPTPQYQQSIEKYAKSQYVRYHAGEDGWTDVLAQAKASPTQPAGFTIKPAPTPAEQAHNLVKDKTPEQIKAMTFAEWQLVLSAGAPEDADKVWSQIKGLSLQMEGNVIKVSPTELEIAASQDDIDKNRADIVLTMNTTIPAKLMPKEGGVLDFEGTPVSYTANPFVMQMEKGTLLTKAAPAPAKKPPVRRKRSGT
jgi:tetratricopeptide (TPR) repeat protein